MAEDHPTEDVDAALVSARLRFEHEFAADCDRMSALLDHVARTHDRDAINAVAQILHRMGGLGGTIGFPRVSAHARELEDWMRDTPSEALDTDEARTRLGALQRAFAEDHAG